MLAARQSRSAAPYEFKASFQPKPLVKFGLVPNFISSTTPGLPTFAKIANRRRLGTTSRRKNRASVQQRAPPDDDELRHSQSHRRWHRIRPDRPKPSQPVDLEHVGG